MPSKYYKKPYRIKKRKSILRNRFFWPGVLIVFLLFTIFYFLFLSDVFQIKKIIITGDKTFSEENVSGLISGKNIFSVDIRDIEREILSSFLQFAEVKIHRNFPDTLDISAVKRLPAAIWCESEDCFLTDEDGVIFQKAANETDLIMISGVKNMLNKEKIAQILKIQERLKNSLAVTTTQALIASEERLNVKTAEGWEIYFNSKGNLDWQLQELSLVLEKQISSAKRRDLEYVDLRFSRVFYK